MTHLRFSGRPFAEQARALESILRDDPLIMEALEQARAADMPDWMIVSGCIYNTVWNHLTGRPSGYGIKDIDLFYFDSADLSWTAEDAVIRAVTPRFASVWRPVEIRNQARVHLWYSDRFTGTCPAYSSSAHALEFFASKTHAVGVRLGNNGRMDIVVPFGLDAIFSFRMAPNPALDNRRTHEEKARRAKDAWPELTILPWQTAAE